MAEGVLHRAVSQQSLFQVHIILCTEEAGVTFVCQRGRFFNGFRQQHRIQLALERALGLWFRKALFRARKKY